MSFKYLLDSFAWIEFFNGTKKGEKVREIIDSGGGATSIIALAEIADKCTREERDVESFVGFIEAKAAIIPLSRDIAVQAGRLKQELRTSAKNTSLVDAIHLQTSRAVGAILVTGDSDFSGVEGILFL